MKDDSNDPIEASTLNILITNIIYS